ncbi:MAG: DUF3726 domain-containing protein [Rhodobacteraceae bacterium]|nr:DUF3726 domain-containing protein [Paracoccaceae bacterium]
MRRSRAEITATVGKAARGAGLSLGIAEELCAAADHLNGEEIAKLADVLARPDDINALCETLDRVQAGEAAALVPPGPAWLLRALALARGIDPDALAPQPEQARPAGTDVAEAGWDRLEALAARTYVPATAASRAAGAGAGLSDND